MELSVLCLYLLFTSLNRFTTKKVKSFFPGNSASLCQQGYVSLELLFNKKEETISKLLWKCKINLSDDIEVVGHLYFCIYYF